MWNFFLWVVIGGAVGWLAYQFVRLGRPGMVTDIVVGAAAAVGVNLLLSLLISGYLNPSFMNVFSLGVALIAAAVVTMIVHVTNSVVRSARA